MPVGIIELFGCDGQGKTHPKPGTISSALIATMFALGGCGFLSHDGPSIRAVESGANGTQGSYSLVELNARSGAIIESIPKPELLGLGRASSSARIDLIGVGDGLSVTIFERSSEALFPASNVASGFEHFSTGVGTERTSANTMPRVLVNRGGDIALPYGGVIHVAGLTTAEAAQAIETSLKGKLVSPQVAVSIEDNVANSVTVIGEVHTPGRYALYDGSDRILDVLALAAGPTRMPADTRVVIARGPMTASIPLSELMRDNAQNIRLAPRDQIRLFYAPRKFNTFGALKNPTEYAIEDDTLTLTGALSRAGGLEPGTANATAVLLFRFERPQVAAALSVRAPVSSKGVPIVYELNLRNPEEFFVASRFEIEPNDLIFVPRSTLSEVRQFIDVVNAASAVAYNIRVTTAVVP